MEQVETPNGEKTPANAVNGNVLGQEEKPDPSALKATNERLLVESKKHKEAYLKTKQELEAKESDLQEKLKADGKYKELYEKATQDLVSLKKQITSTTVMSQVKSAAEKAGFVKPENILKFGNQSLLTYDEDSGAVYGVDAFLESAKVEYPQMFSAHKTPVINPVTPNGAGTLNNAKPLSALSKDEIMNRLRSMK